MPFYETQCAKSIAPVYDSGASHTRSYNPVSYTHLTLPTN